MKLLSIDISNAYSFGKNVHLDFNKLDQHTQIIGRNIDEDLEEASNGSGKTSLYLCIQQVLFGKDSKDTLKADIANTLGDGSYEIHLSFLEKGDTYIISASRTSSGKGALLLKKNSKDISCHTIPGTQKLIQSIIGLDFTLFTQLTYQSTDKFLDLLSATDAERKKVLVNLFSLDRYDDQVLLFKDLVRATTLDLKVASTKLEIIKDAANVKIDDIVPENIVRSSDELNRLILEKDKLTTEIANLDKTNKEYAYHTSLSLNLDILKSKVSTAGDTPEFTKEELADVVSKLATINQSISQYNKLLSRYESSPENCRTCGQPVPTEHNVEKAKDCRDNLQTLIDRKNSLLEAEALLTRKKELVAARNLDLLEISRLSELLDLSKVKSPLLLSDKLALSTTLSDLIFKEKASIKESQDIAAKRARHNARVAVLTEQKLEAEKRLEEAEKDYSVCVYKASHMKALYDASKLLVTFKLESLLLYLQNSVNEYVDALFQGDVALTIGTAKGKLSFTIMKGGTAYSIKRLSTGERSRMNISVLLALRDTLESLSGAEIDFLVLDEILSSLDSVGRTSVYEILEKLPYKILSISHSYQDNRLPSIDIIKKNGLTEIVQ